MRKLTTFLLITIASVAITTFYACNKEITQNIKYQDESKSLLMLTDSTQLGDTTNLFEVLDIEVLDYSVLENIYLQIIAKYGDDFREEGIFDTISEDQELRDIIQPLVDNGQQIHSKLVSFLSTTEEWSNLTADEQGSILFYNDVQYAQLGLIYSATDENFRGGMYEISSIRDCLSAALGLGELYYLTVANPRALMTVSGALKILKLVGLRYLSYLGLALAILDFLDCIG